MNSDAMRVKEIDEHHLVIDFPDKVDPELCQNTIVGYIEGVLKLYQVMKFSVTHQKCLFRGDSICSYDITWSELE
jgi:predicted hydrocarbon binding protein